jgi:hypothetical protein
MPRLYEFFSTSSAPEQILTDINRTVIEAARVKLIGTNFVAMRLGPGDIVGTSLNIVKQAKNSYLPGLVGQGAEIPIKEEDTYAFQVTPRKYGVRPLITREMQEDSLFAVMERNLSEAGRQMARKMDRLIIGAMRRGAGQTVTGLAAITVANLTTAINRLETQDFALSDCVFGPDVAMDIRNIDTFVEANKSGVNDPSRSLIGQIYNGRVWVSNNIVSLPDSTAAATATDAIAVDREYGVVFAEKRPIMVERYNDVTRQLDGIVLSARWDTNVIPDTDQGLTGAFTTRAVQLITTT